MKKSEILEAALKKFEAIQERERDQREYAIEDLNFVNAEDGQWEEDIIEKRGDRPRYTFDRIEPAINQLVGDQRQNRTSIKVYPLTDSDVKTAEIFTGLIRSIEQNSSAENAYDPAYREQITCGYGGFKIITDYESDDSFDQEIKIRPIQSAATSLFFDSNAEEYDKRDAQCAFLVTKISSEAFKERYPEATATDFTGDNYQNNSENYWFAGDDVTIAEYWYKDPIKKTIGEMSNGQILDLDEESAVIDDLAKMGITVTKTRVVDSHVVKMVIMSGAEILEGPQDWAGKFIPLIPVYGRVSHVGKQTFIRGIVRKAKDAQRVFNYSKSTIVEITATTPKDPYLATSVQLAAHKAQWEQMNTLNPPVLLYDPDPLSPGPPTRGGAPQVQQALIQQSQDALGDIYASTGLEPASLGQNVGLKSGKAVQAEQDKGDRGVYDFQDNLQKSIAYAGDVLVDLIPRVYDTERVIKTLKLDGSSDDVVINQAELDGFNMPVVDEQTGETVIVNDLSAGKFSVEVSSGPAFTTRRQESVEQIIGLMNALPELGPLVQDLLIKNSDFLEGDEAYERVRKAGIKAGVIEPTDEEKKELGLDQPQPPDKGREALANNLDAQSENERASAILKMSQTEMNDAKTEQIITNTMESSVKALSDMLEAFIKKQEAGLLITEQDQDLLDNQATVTEIAQEEYIQETNALNDMQIEKEREEEQAEMIQQQQAQQIPQGEPPQGPPQPT